MIKNFGKIMIVKRKKFDVSDVITESIITKTKLMESCIVQIESIGAKLASVIKNGKKILLCGNGGSAADSQHIAAEMVIRYRSSVNRPAIPAIALTVDPSIMTAGGNDIGFENVFARSVEAYGKKGDAIIGISTSGNSENVYRAIKQAQQMKMTTIGLLGCGGGKINLECDYSLVVPSDVTARIQESHILIGHIWCELIEEILFPELIK
jgi:D-sedoheptulose 7-phosphate isomerase